MGTDERLSRIREIRRRLAGDGPPRTCSDGAPDFQTVTLPEAECDRLCELLITERVETVVEIGLAYGSSALAIGEALVTVDAPQPSHVIVDPFQASAYRNAGWEVLQAAGLGSIITLLPEWSSIALPRLVTDELLADAAFVDGSHRFHEVFVDLYFLRKVVRPGGLIVLDDRQTPSVGTALRYYERNLGWQAIHGLFAEDSRCAAFRLPDRPFEPPFEEFQPF